MATYKKKQLYGVFRAPSVIVDGEVKCTRKVPEKEDIVSWLERLRNKQCWILYFLSVNHWMTGGSGKKVD